MSTQRHPHWTYSDLASIDSLDGLRQTFAANGRASLVKTWQCHKLHIAIIAPHDRLHGDRMDGVELRIMVLATGKHRFNERDAALVAFDMGMRITGAWRYDSNTYRAMGEFPVLQTTPI